MTVFPSIPHNLEEGRSDFPDVILLCSLYLKNPFWLTTGLLQTQTEGGANELTSGPGSTLASGSPIQDWLKLWPQAALGRKSYLRPILSQ